MKGIVRQAFTALFLGGMLLGLFWLICRLLPPAGLLLYFPSVVGLEILEDHGLKTLQSSPDGWPVATHFGLWIAGVAWWLLCSLAALVVLRLTGSRTKRYGGAV